MQFCFFSGIGIGCKPLFWLPFYGAFPGRLQTSYRCLLPHPEHGGKFDVSTRERILRMSGAFTTDESARRDRLADAEIVETPKGRRAAVAIMVLCLAAAAASVFVVNNTVAAGIFLAVPVASIVRDLIRGRRVPDETE